MRGLVSPRTGLVAKYDIHNAIRKFKIRYDTYLHEDDAISVRLWIRSNMGTTEYPVLYYKGKGDKHKTLDIDVFVLVFMTKTQATMPEQFGSDVICIDETPGTNAYKFQLYTIMVIDSTGAGFPVAFCFSNRSDELLFRIFFEAIHSFTSPIHTTKFMSDDAPGFYNAWILIMGNPKNYLLCTWHVKHCWLRSAKSKIQDFDKREEVLNKLYNMQQILDEDEFLTNFQKFLLLLQESDSLLQFYNYFKSRYCSKLPLWAYCYRKGLAVNTNMYLESFHNVLKNKYLKGKEILRLNHAIHALKMYEADAFVEWKRRSEGCAQFERQKNVRGSHKESLHILSEQIINVASDEWIVR